MSGDPRCAVAVKKGPLGRDAGPGGGSYRSVLGPRRDPPKSLAS